MKYFNAVLMAVFISTTCLWAGLPEQVKENDIRFMHLGLTLDAEVDRFVENYGDTEKEQAYTVSLEMLEIALVEYYFQSAEPPADWGKDENLFYFGDGYYLDSGLFNERVVAVLKLEPISVE